MICSEHLVLLLFLCYFLHRCTLSRSISLERATESSEALGAACALGGSIASEIASDSVLELGM